MNVGQLIEDLVQAFVAFVSGAVTFASNFLTTLLSFNLSEIGNLLETLWAQVVDFSADFLGFVVVAAGVAAFAFYFGRNRIVPLVAALYASIPLFLLSPFDLTPYGGVIVQVAFWVLLVLLGMVAFSTLASFMASVSTGFVNVVVLSVATAGLVLAIAINVIPIQTFYTFSPATLALFDTPQGVYFWLIAPLAALFVFGRG